MTFGLLPPAIALMITVSALLLFAYARRGKAGAAVQLIFAVYAANYGVFTWAYGNPSAAADYATLIVGALEGPAIWWLAQTKNSENTGLPAWQHILVPASLLLMAAILPPTYISLSFGALSVTRLAYVLAAGFIIWPHLKTSPKARWVVWVGLLAAATAGLSVLKLSALGVFLMDNSWYAPTWLIVLKSIGISAAVLTLLWWAMVKPEILLGRRPKGETKAATTDEQDLYKRFTEMMRKDRLFLHETLKISDAAEVLSVLPRELSEAINRSSGNSFKAEVRRLRISFACTLLLGEPKTSVLEIAHRSGFATKSVFNTAFKEVTGLSPSAYRKKGHQS
ncbi:helix-turn-helix domain-containing protein [Kordiimonas lacus]|uniref:AraC-type DNA-binding protein n=1 Tax=Kordiimonas lacus TaxID=637679 RepID=A0A1G6XXS1_9PROT|nr:helix-turn-helix domain-containing protein [Kordiimonas lacus]SDD82781.1 AraC-type DNA-binding protein [Kordiimonas lacus]